MKQKQKQNNKQNPTTKTKQREAKQKQNKRNKEGFRANRGGPLGHLTWPLNPPKTKYQKETNKNNTYHITEPSKPKTTKTETRT